MKLAPFPALMVQGTTSDAGKSTLVTALARYYHRQGVAVAPFKPQNMALNSAVTIDGGEIGRAQAVQAAACGLSPHHHMNPVLLKPSSDTVCQVIIQGRVFCNLSAQAFHDYKPVAKQAVLDSWACLTQQYPMVLVEGAGSPAEINLRAGDIANMGFAEAVDCPVILIADIDRGGVFAHLIGTLDLLSASEQQRVLGFVINRFRGDIALLQPGLDWLENRTGKPVLAVLPYLHDFYIDAEDALSTRHACSDDHYHPFQIVVPHLPGFSNHTDFDPLQLHPGLRVTFAAGPDELTGADLIILPGSKAVGRDLERLRQMGWPAFIQRHLRYGGKVLGICGGFQMLGDWLHDPHGLEGQAGSLPGLGLLAMSTELQVVKCLRNSQGVLMDRPEIKVQGYEIHHGISQGPALALPWLQLEHGVDGAVSADGLIAGTYLHGLFDLPEACNAILAWAGYQAAGAIDFAARREAGIDRLADLLEQHFDFAALERAVAAYSRERHDR